MVTTSFITVRSHIYTSRSSPTATFSASSTRTSKFYSSLPPFIATGSNASFCFARSSFVRLMLLVDWSFGGIGDRDSCGGGYTSLLPATPAIALICCSVSRGIISPVVATSHLSPAPTRRHLRASHVAHRIPRPLEALRGGVGEAAAAGHRGGSLRGRDAVAGRSLLHVE